MANSVGEGRKLFKLSLNQRNIWELEHVLPGTAVNIISTTLSAKGSADGVLIEKALNLVTAADESLRTRITLVDNEPMQYHAPFEEEHFPYYDFSATDEEGIASFERELSREAMPLYDSPLYRFVIFKRDDETVSVLVKTHHIISDGWTQVALLGRICRAYTSLTAGAEPEIENLPSYEQYVEDEQKYLSSSAFRRDEEYWKTLLAKPGEPVALKSARGGVLSNIGKRLSRPLPEKLNNLIYNYCVQWRAAPFIVFYMALALYLRKAGGGSRFTLGVPVFNRSNNIFKNTTGMFVSTIPFTGEIAGEWSLNEFRERIEESWLELLRHQRFPFADMRKLSRSDSPLFNIMLSYQDNKLCRGGEGVSFSGRWHYSGVQAEQLCVHLLSVEENRKYTVEYDYLTQLFSENEIITLHEALCRILSDALASPDAPLCNLALAGDAELERVVYGFNETSAEKRGLSLFETLKKEADAAPERPVVIYNGVSLSYRDLISECGRTAAALEGKSGMLAAVILPRTPQLLIAMAGIMQAGCAWVIVPPDTPEGRVSDILSQSGAGVIISTNEILGRLSSVSLADIPSIDMNGLPQTSDKAAPVTGESQAYVVYTSGSTGRPKGVEISQRNLLNLAEGMRPLYAKGAIISLCSTGFDAFILESAAAMLCGRTIVFPQEQELESPSELAELMRAYSAGFLSVTPSRLSAFMRNSRFKAELRGLETIICGGEAFPAELLQELKKCTNARIINQYGPSETTVGVSFAVLNSVSRITAGKPMENCRLYVLDDWKRPLPAGIFGNLFVGGDSVGLGYRNAPELTAESFFDDPFVKGGRIYKTGDVAAWTQSGEIVLAGRKDRQIKLRGLRVEPQEAAACIARFEGVTDAAAKVISKNGQQILVAYYISDSEIPEAKLTAFAAEYLPRYMIPTRILRIDKMPLTANGKTDEAALPEPEGDDKPMRASGEFQELLLGVFRRVLNNDAIHAGSDYFLCGGNSLSAMEAIGEIEEATGLRLRVSDFYACRTVKRLDEYLSTKSDGEPVEISFARAPKRARYPISPMQSNIYVQSFMDPARLAYNMPGAFRLGFEPDRERLENAFKLLISGDDCFRTSFVQSRGEVYAEVADGVEFELNVLRGTREKVFGGFLKPFDLSKAPLLRAALWENEGEWTLLVDTHHIIGDGVSTPIIMERLSRYYAGESVVVPFTYKDYVCDMEIRREGLTDEKKYWEAALTPLPESLDMPLDAPRPAVFDYKGANLSVELSPELTKNADELCEKLGITPYMLYLGTYGILLSKITGQSDFVIGTPVAGRLRPELQKICGLFMNTLPLRLRTAGKIKNYLLGVKDAVLGMLDNQKLPLESIISMLNLPRTLSRNPLYQTLFSYRPLDESDFTLDGRSLEYVPVPTGSTKLDLSIEAARSGDKCVFCIEYASSLFTRETAELYGRSLLKLISAVVSGEAETVEELDAASDTDRDELLDAPVSRHFPYPDKTLSRIFTEQAEETPDATAVIWHDDRVSFRELNERADQIASLLTAKGVKRGDRVGLLLRRTPDLLASMLGILKAGAAYLPCITDYPVERVNYMLGNAQARLLLSDPVSLAMLDGGISCPIATTDESAARAELEIEQELSDPIYVLYTSGSTGRPKGAQIPHRAITNLLETIKNVMADNRGPVLCTSNVTFDIFITESLLALAQGLTVVLADEEEMMLPWKMAELITKHGAKAMQLTPSRMTVALGNDAFRTAVSGIEAAIVAGEMVTPRLVKDFKSCCKGRLINMYGPTEAAVYVAYGELSENAPVAIGRPVNNCRIYILDENRKPVMPTARGEIYLAGDCLADGYISRPELTEELFLPDPFFPEERMYKSGDIGRIRADGVIECLGRKDSQIKINGIRVELDEISTAMTKSGAAAAVTLAQKNPDTSTSLLGFVTPGDIDTADLKVRLSAILPPYMIPSQIRAIDKIPYNASGKTDIQALKRLLTESAQTDRPAQEAPKAEQPEKSAQQGGTLRMILELWGDTLGEAINPDISFFEQGGSSLGALNILSQYFNRGLTMTLEQFYGNPSPVQQAQLLAPQIVSEEPEKAPEAADMPEPPAEVPAAPETVSYPETVPAPTGSIYIGLAERVLLTGATGYLGVHLLRALLERGIYKVACVLRDGSRDRLLDTLKWYFGESWTKRNAAFVEVISGDITKPGLGISTEDYARIRGSFRAIYHTAADVRHYTDGKSSESVNLKGTENVIALAMSEKVPLMHISTASISGDFIKSDPLKSADFTENDFYIGQNFEDNIYVKTKFLAENAVYSAMERGLEARVFRIGRLVARRSDGVFQKNAETNAFYTLTRSIGRLGALPRSMALAPVEITPVDVCADAILALETAPLTTYHILQPNPAPLGEVINALYPGLRIVEDGAFEKLLLEHAAAGEAQALAPLIETCNKLKSVPMSIKVSSESTHRCLHGLGFSWPEMGAAYKTE